MAHRRNDYQRGNKRFNPLRGNSRGRPGFNRSYDRSYDYDGPYSRRFEDYPPRGYQEYDNPNAYGRGYEDYGFQRNARAPDGFMQNNGPIKVVPKKPDKYTKDNAVFVTNIPIELCYPHRQKEVLSQFEKYGTIIQKVVFARDSKTGEYKGTIFVIYETSEQAKEAIKELDGHVFGAPPPEKKPIVQTPTVPIKGIKVSLKRPDKYTKDNVIFVQDIPHALCNPSNRPILLSKFENCGTIIQKVTFAKDTITGEFKGTIFVVYENNEQAQAAINEMDGHIFEDFVEKPPPVMLPDNEVVMKNNDKIILKDNDSESVLPLAITFSEAEHGLRVRNVPSFCRTSDIVRLFERYGQICTDIQLADDPASDVGTLTCLIIYKRPDDGEVALEALNGYTFEKSAFVPSLTLHVKFAERKRGSKANTSLYVGNIPKSYGIKDLENLFKKFGTVNQEITMPRDKYTGEPRGITFISFETEDQALAAQQGLDGIRIEVSKEEYFDYYYGTNTAREHYERITVKHCFNAKHGKSIYIAGIPIHFSEEKAKQEVERVFSTQGKVVTVDLPKDKYTGYIRGIGYITYDTKEEAELAIAEMNDKLIKDLFPNDSYKQQYDYYTQDEWYTREEDQYRDYYGDSRRTPSGVNTSQGSVGRKTPGLDDSMRKLSSPREADASAGPSSTTAAGGPVVNALTSLMNVCSHLPILGSSLREALSRALEQCQDAEGVLSFFQAKETSGLLDLVLLNLEKLLANSSDADERDLFTSAIGCIGVLKGTDTNSEETDTISERTNTISERTNTISERTNTNPERTNTNPERTNTDQERTYANQERTYTNQERAYANQERAYATQERTYANQESTYANPESTYANQERAYANQERTYANQERTYASQERAYASQERSYGYTNQETTYNNPERTYNNTERSYNNPERTYTNSERSSTYSERTSSNRDWTGTTRQRANITRERPSTNRDDDDHNTSGSLTFSVWG